MVYGNDPPAVLRAPEDDPLLADVSRAIQDAIQYVEGELGPERAKATEYYHAEPFGNEETGRSKVVLSEVRDGILGIIPSVLRLAHGPEHVVEYTPRRGDAVDMAEQATDYARYIFEEDNPGFLISHSILKDALLKKIGVAAWGLTEEPVAAGEMYRGITPEDATVLVDDPAVTVVSNVHRPDGLLDVEITRTTTKARIWVMPVPPEDFFWNREARSIEDARLVGFRTRKTRGELIALGISEDVLDEHGGTASATVVTAEENARRAIAGSAWSADVPMGDANRRIVYCEAYAMLDTDGDGIAELRKVCTVGEGYHVVKNVPAARKQVAMFSPDPEPHAMLGGSYYDRLKDMQLVNSQLLRTILDSAAIAAFPRMGYVEGQVSVADILNTAIGAPVRMRAPGMVQPFSQEFTGEKLLPMLGVTQEIIERRIGQKDGASSLDMDALQSTGKEAVNAALTAASAQAELLTRLYAEQFLKPLFRGLLELIVHPASRDRIVRLRGQYTAVHPSRFDPDMDVAVTVTLGSMDREKKQAVLQMVIADQSAILQQFGPQNPVVTLPMLRNAKAKALALAGIRDVERYYRPLPDDWQPPPPEPPQPSSDELWIQAEKEMTHAKAMKELAIKQDELDLKREQMQIDATLKGRELAIREQALFEGQHGSEIERYKSDVQAAVDRERIAADTALAQQKMEHERVMAAEAAQYEAASAAAEHGDVN